MRTRKQKKVTCMVWVTTALASMMALAGGTQGMDIAEKEFNRLTAEKKLLETQLSAKQGETRSLQEKLKVVDGEKKKLEQEQTNLRLHITKIKEMTGGSGRNTPILERVDKLRKEAEVKTLIEQKLADIPGENLPDKIGSIQVVLKDTTTQVAEIRAEIGEHEEEVAPVLRVRALSDSLKRNTGNLKEAVNLLEEKLKEVEGEDCVSKVDSLKKEVEDTSAALNVLDEKLSDVPGNGLLEKVKTLQRELELAKNTLEVERKETLETREALARAQQDAQEKEQAYSDLYVELLRTTTQAKLLDEELSKTQVESLENREKLNHVLSKQFQSDNRDKI